jgi:hypothetical protein
MPSRAAGPHRVDLIRDQLEASLRAGLRPAALARCPKALDLIPEGDPDPYRRAIEVRDLLVLALGDLGDGDVAEAAHLLWGDHEDSRGRILKDRRRLAAEYVNMQPSHFRRDGGLEDNILDDIAVAIWLRATA